MKERCYSSEKHLCFLRACRIVFVFIALSITAQGQTSWFVRPDGGTRFSKANPTGQCDGKADVRYRGSGHNQHCAFNDVRWLWTDGSYTINPKAGAPSWGWTIAGGDTVIIRGGPWRIGQKGPKPSDYFGLAGAPYQAGAPAIPSGTSAHHTRILGENYATCNTKTQLFGGYAVGSVLNLQGSQYVDIQCMEITDHAQCGRTGTTNQCSSSFPLDDFAKYAIVSNTSTGNVWISDVDIHGMGQSGWFGPIGGDIHTNRLRIAFNPSAGIDLDDGNNHPSTGGTFTLQNALIEWNGCIEEYPIVDAVPAFTCFDQNSAGYGDAIGTPNGDAASFNIDQSIIRYNTQDGPDLLHSSTGSFVITRSQMYGNMGQQLKLGATSDSTVQNNLIIGNCQRLSAPMAGAPDNYNVHLSNFCRAAGDGIAIAWGGSGTTMHFDYNTYLGYSATTMDIFCSLTDCSSGTKTLRNNIFIGYVRSGYDGNQKPGMIYYGKSASDSFWSARSNNIYYEFRSCPAGMLTRRFPGESCRDPNLTSIPSAGSMLRSEDVLDLQHLTLYPAPNSPVIGAGIAIQGVITDHTGAQRLARPSIGALEPKR